METKQLNVELNWTHVGQYRPYGDTFRECEIHTPDTLDEKDILELVIIMVNFLKKNGRKVLEIL